MKNTVGRHFDKAFAGLASAKSEINQILKDAIRYQWTHSQLLKATSEMREQSYYRKLPRWAKSEITGFESAKLASYEYGSSIGDHLEMMHLYKGKLYVDFKQWRDAHDGLVNSSELTNSVVNIWKVSGKIFFAGTDTDAERNLQGQTFPFYTE